MTPTPTGRDVETIDEVLGAFGEFIADEVAATTMALGGLRTLAHMVVTELERGMDPRDSLLVGANVPDVGWILRFENLDAARAHAERVSEGGATSIRLTQQFIVTLDTAWEEEFRTRVARARGLSGPSEVRVNFFGDVRRLRNDIVHHRGVVTAKNAARCTSLRRTFNVGDSVYLDNADLLNVRLQVPWAVLAGREHFD